MKRIACWGCVLGLVAVELGTIAALAVAGDSTTGFGRSGKVVTAVGPGDSIPSALIVDPDGKLVAAGGSGKNSALVRYNRDGSLDTGFGRGGKVTTAIRGGSASASALVLQPDGKVVAAGQSTNGSKPSMFTFVRYKPNGSLDLSFGRGGKVTTAIGSGESSASALVLQPDGKLVAAGDSVSSNPSTPSAVFYHANGNLDTSFGRAGKVTPAIGPGVSLADSLVLQPDRKLIAAGSWETGSFTKYSTRTYFALARYTPNGSLDNRSSRGG